MPAPTEECWQLALAISPRRRCRVDTRDGATGEWRHDYRDAPLPADPGVRPTAIYLTDSPPLGPRRHRLLAFDLDARRGDVDADLVRLRQILDQAAIPHVVCTSGPGGGRHVWASAGAAGAEPRRVAHVARALATQLPTLDVAPLTNPSTGAVRPPGAPHRAGGRAQLLDPTTPAAARARLQHDGEGVVDRLAAVLDLQEATSRPGPHPADSTAARIVHLDGGPALAGDPRPLPARILAQLASAPGPDTSAALARVLVGLALARWSWPMVAALLPDPASRGLEHARSRRGGRGRRPRSATERLALLRRQWSRAVAHAATLPDRATEPAPPPPGDAESQLSAHVAAVQAHADREPARWARPSGPADRGVLDALCLVALTCRSAAVDLDVRRAGQLAGVSPAAAARALRRLALDGWIRLALPAEGRRAARWALTEPLAQSQGETQAPHPLPTGVRVLEILRERASVRGADLFVPRLAGGLGRHAARVALAMLTPVTPAHLATVTGYTSRTIQRCLRRFGQLGVRARRGPRTHLRRSRLVTAARTLGVHGYRAAQARLVAVGRELWAWWQEELNWMHAPERWHRPSVGQRAMAVVGALVRPPFPRRPDGRADYPTARLHVLRERGLDLPSGGGQPAVRFAA